ncbi:Protein CBG15074 [Caenorhabditis briggsae]|uniref:Protein CBG15074 n=1 Tax=Caenorhabditis briggsae TaxID=6238 RepID=A8XLC0_CAEBR|nr:Protein CBG15074 [Caenorhabditis briggsae]CAP33445.2 Protein CBG15074 [Caenorhabditis briggsae]
MSQQSKKNAEHMEWEQQEGDGRSNGGSKRIAEEGGKWGDGLEPEKQDVLESAEKSRKSAATLGDGNSTEKKASVSVREVCRYTKVTARVRDVVLKPVQQFVEQLAKRHRELDSGKWERIVMRMMRDHGIENFSELQAAISIAGRKERVADEEVEKSDNEWKLLQKSWELQNDELGQHLEKARAEAEDLQLQLDAVQIEKERCEKEVERLERAWKLERKTAKELRQMMEQSTGNEKRDQERSKVVIQERYRRPGTQSVDSRGSSSAWAEPESQKRGEAKGNGVMGRKETESD